MNLALAPRLVQSEQQAKDVGMEAEKFCQRQPIKLYCHEITL